MLTVSTFMIGAMASKKARSSSPVWARTASARAIEVSGPVAMMTLSQSSGGMVSISSRMMVMRGWASSVWVTSSEKPSRSTARALPAGTWWLAALAMMRPSQRRISSCRTPTAFPVWSSERKELEQTSSARPSVWWASVPFTPRISCRMTGTPARATCHAASLPAMPPPMIWTGFKLMATRCGVAALASRRDCSICPRAL